MKEDFCFFLQGSAKGKEQGKAGYEWQRSQAWASGRHGVLVAAVQPGGHMPFKHRQLIISTQYCGLGSQIFYFFFSIQIYIFIYSHHLFFFFSLFASQRLLYSPCFAGPMKHLYKLDTISWLRVWDFWHRLQGPNNYLLMHMNHLANSYKFCLLATLWGRNYYAISW